jgi:type IV pilus assembly protein PilB
MTTLPGRKLLGEILVQRGLVGEADVARALELQKSQGGAVGTILVQMGCFTQEQLMEALSEQFGMEVVELPGLTIPADAVDRVEYSVASTYKVMPVKWDGTVLVVAMANPLDVATLDDLRTLLGCDVQGAVSNEKDILEAHKKYYRREDESIERLMEQFGQAGGAALQEGSSETIDLESVEEMAESAPVRKLVNLVLLTAVRERASDIHFEPYEDDYRIRQRIDGILYEMVPPPKHLATAIASRLKVMSDLNIAERRLPQDGRIMLNIAGRPVDLRVSVIPTMFGESVVLRVLDRSVVQLDLDQIGMRADELGLFRTQIAKPNGILLVTGPTGCGKTTTLYAALREVNEVGVKILTAEDPIEYDLEGVVQVNVNEAIGVSFDRLLRHYLRQDPDKILVGEIRDKETGDMAIQASLTGHIVLSTLHTMDAPSAVTRLLDLGLEPYLVTATLECIVAQRLVRKICEECKEEYHATDEVLWQLGLSREQVAGRTFYYGKGCDHCMNTGYYGRTGVFEIMVMDDRLRDMIMERSSTNALRQAAIERGMRTLRQAGLLHVYDGITSIEEVVRATIDEEI